MRGCARTLCMLAILAASPVAEAAAPIFGSPAESRSAREAIPAKGKAIIYIYRRHDDANGTSPVIWLNTYEVGRLVPGAFTAWQLSPGRLEIRADGVETSSLALTAQAGEVYLIRVSVSATAAGLNASLTRLPSGTGRADMAATRLLKNPRELPATLAAAPPAAPPPRAAPAEPAPAPKPPAMTPAEQIPVGGFALLLKSGALRLSEDTQEIGNIDRSLDDKASGLYAVEAQYQFRDGVSVGGEIIGYSTELSTPGIGESNDVDVFIFFLNAKKHFRRDSRLQPFIGAGLGGATTDVSGPTISGSTSGFAFQLMAGIEYRTPSIGFHAEVKHIGADTESSNDENVDVSGTGLFLGVVFHF